MSFAIRDAAMLLVFITRMCEVGLFARKVGGPEGHDLFCMAWETMGTSHGSDFCAEVLKDAASEDLLGAVTIRRPPVFITLEYVKCLIDAHEGGAILFEGRRPLQ